MKKTVKMLIATACVASIAGVSAVSFAKWDPVTATEASGSFGTGYISLTGFTSDTLDLGTKTLIPYDQTDVDVTVEGATDTKMISVAIPEYQVSSNYTLTAKVGAALPAGTYYVKLNTSATETAATSTDGWTALTTDGVSLTLGSLAYTADSDVLQTKTGAYLHIILDSNSGLDMSQTSTISLKLAETNS